MASVLTTLILAWAAASSSAGEQPRPNPGAYGLFDFPTCVRYALVHSDELQKARIDVQIASADLKDAHAELLPTIQINTRYYLAKASDNNNPGGISVQLLMTNWDPYLALLKMKHNAILVDIGKINHQDKIADNIEKLAKEFYRIHALEKTIRARRSIVALHRNKLDFARSRQEQGSYDDLDVRAAANALRGEQVKIKGLDQELAYRLATVKILMGYHPDFELPLDTRDAVNQILQGFNGRLITFADVQGANYRLKIAAKNEQLQSNRITGSYVALIPKPLIVFENVENQVDRTSGFNMALGLDYTLWDGFKRVRDIKRQRLKARQLEIDRKLLSEEKYANYQRIRSELEGASDKEGFYREQVKIAELNEEKALIMYKAGELLYDQYIQRRIERAEAEISSISSVESRVNALIEMAGLTGGLSRYNGAIRY